jgi:hypothetical protein
MAATIMTRRTAVSALASSFGAGITSSTFAADHGNSVRKSSPRDWLYDSAATKLRSRAHVTSHPIGSILQSMHLSEKGNGG